MKMEMQLEFFDVQHHNKCSNQVEAKTVASAPCYTETNQMSSLLRRDHKYNMWYTNDYRTRN